MTISFLVCATVTAISAIVSFGFSAIAAYMNSGATQLVAFYALARSLALVIVSVAAFAVGAIGWLEAAACCMTIIQACDAAIGIKTNKRLKIIGPAFTSILNLIALGWLLAARHVAA